MSGKPLKLLTLNIPAPQFDASKGVDGLPRRIRILGWGRNETTQGPVIVNENTVKLLFAYNKSQNWDRPYWDFEHSSIPGSPTYKGEPVKIAATGEFLDRGGLEVVPGEGVFMLSGSYTPDGKELLPAGHYPDISPVVKVNDRDELIGVHSAAFCRQGATTGLIFLSATSNPKSTMDPKKPQTADELMKALAEMLSLGADCTPTDILQSLAAALKKTDGPAPVNEEVKQLTASVNSLTQIVTAQTESLKLLSASHETSERGNIMVQAAREGKVVPEMAKDLPIDQLKLLCAQLPVTVPVGQRQTDAGLMLLSVTPADDPELAKLDAEMGVTKEERQKFLKK